MSDIVPRPAAADMVLKVGKDRYLHVSGILQKEGEIFITGMGRKTASYAKKRLREILKRDIEVLPGTWRNQDGYYFKVNTDGQRAGEKRAGDS